jgi:hypothetical protein
MQYKTFWLLVPLYWLLFTNASGQELSEQDFLFPAAALPSVATVEVGGDSEDTRQFVFDIDYGLVSGNRLLFSYGRSYYQYNSVEYDEIAYLVGLSTDPLDEFVYSMNYQYWDRDQRLSSDGVQGSLQWQPQDWSLALLPELRYISLRRRGEDIRLGIRNPGLGVSAAYLGFDKLSINFSHFKSQYSNESVDALRSYPYQIRILSARIAQEFDESRTTMGGDWRFFWGTMGIEWQRSASVFDQNTYYTTTLSSSIELSEDWSTQLRLGRAVGPDDYTVEFASAGLSYQW